MIMTIRQAFVLGIIIGVGVFSLIASFVIVNDVAAQTKAKCYRVDLRHDEGLGMYTTFTGTVCEQ